MDGPVVTMGVRHIGGDVAVVDIKAEVTAACEPALISAYEEATAGGQMAGAPLLAWSMNSGCIWMRVTLLVRANWQRQQLAAYGLSHHYREIFELTRLDEAITIYDDEASALVGATT
jgi:hypothetical protein